MIRINSTRYYGYFTTSGGSSSDMVFHVLCIAPPSARVRDYIGSKSVKFTDLLCFDDFVLASLPVAVDWSEVQKY